MVMTVTLRTRVRWMLGLLVALGVSLGYMTWSTPAAAQSANGVRGLPDFSDLVEQVGPSVVNIRVLERVRGAGSGGDLAMDLDLQELFRRFGFPIPNIPRGTPRPGNRDQESEAQPRGVGSGFILSSDGIVMTNAHVVEGADEVIVTLTDKREFKAKILGADKRTDVAIVKIQAGNLPAVKIGDVNRLRVGEWVMAIGSPFGLDNSVTAGIVSAKQRDIGDYVPFIQTDVAINPGNSGGPLINMRGEVVGINSQIYSRSGGSMGISFSIPIDEAVRVSEQLKTQGRVVRGRLGIQLNPVSKEVAETIGMDKPHGAMVRVVENGGPADKAGLEAGDIITHMDGRKVETMLDLPRWIGNTKPGTRVSLSVLRHGKKRELPVVVGELESDARSARTGNLPEEEKSKASGAAQFWGLSVVDLTDAQKKDMRLRGGVRLQTATESAARAGLRSGDVVLAVGQQEILSLADFEAALTKADRSKNLMLLVRRAETTQYVILRPPVR